MVKEKRAPQSIVCFWGGIGLLGITVMLVLSVEMTGFLKGYAAHS